MDLEHSQRTYHSQRLALNELEDRLDDRMKVAEDLESILEAREERLREREKVMEQAEKVVEEKLSERERIMERAEKVIEEAEIALVARAGDTQFGSQLVEWSVGEFHQSPFYVGRGWRVVLEKVEGEEEDGEGEDE